ncbi:MAG: hypothetical protein K1X36_00470 [Pyrinomonadaceae bacterium]|nr:hypothetical protein [Pyrinomonadaceae bacterium]
MELEFDKEIDAILRKARSGTGAAGTAAGSPHLDADTIAAFVENALPQRSKALYMEHIADCDRCRRVLSQTILLNSGAEVKTAAAEAETRTDTAPDQIIPWYKRLFATPALAAAMGAVILAFSGILGYVVLQERNRPNSDISRATEPGPVQGGPFYGGEADYPTANKAPSAVAANSAPMPPPNSTANSSVAAANRTDGSTAEAANTRVGSDPKPEAYADARRTAEVAAPPPAPAAGVPATVVGEAKSDDGTLKAKEEDSAVASKANNDSLARDIPMAAKKSGPVRSGPSNAQVQMQTQNVITENSLRTVNGKSFDRRGGVWYDLAYKGQSTKKVSRGSGEYKDLDGGLRNIAETLDGTVVVMWKEKAYRIQ